MTAAQALALPEDRWLSERLGHRVFNVPAAELDLATLQEHVESNAPATYQARVSTGRVDLVASLTRAGFTVVSTGVTLGRSPAAAGVANRAGWDVRPAEPERDQEILNVALRSFDVSRFHLDPAIPTEVADGIKRDWVASYLRRARGESLMVAVRDGLPVGFLAVLAAIREGARVRVIDLIGVAPEWQCVGVGCSLVTRFLAESVGACDAVEVGTQVANDPAIRFYERQGFLTLRTFYDLHLHV